MKQKLYNFFIGGDKFKKDFKDQLRMLIIFTFGFTIAFAWRQTAFDTTQSLVRFFTHLESNASLSIVTSIVLSIFSLLVIYLSSRWLQED